VTDWPYLRFKLKERSRGYCEACSWPVGEEWAAHHRLLRAQGGEHEMPNLLILHHGCHNIAPKSVHQNPEWSYERGLMLRMGSDPASSPMQLPEGNWVLLDDTYTHYQKEG